MGELERRGGPRARRDLVDQQVPSKLREAILAATKILLDALPENVELTMRFGADVDHLFRHDRSVDIVPRPKEVDVELHAEAPLAGVDQHGYPIDFVVGGWLIGKIVDRGDGELDLLLVSWQRDMTRAWP